LNPSILKTGRPACHRRPLTSPRHSIGATASARSALLRSGFVPWHETDMARCPTWVRCALQSGRRRNGLDQGDARQCAFLCGGNVDRL